MAIASCGCLNIAVKSFLTRVFDLQVLFSVSSGQGLVEVQAVRQLPLRMVFRNRVLELGIELFYFSSCEISTSGLRVGAGLPLPQGVLAVQRENKTYYLEGTRNQ